MEFPITNKIKGILEDVRHNVNVGTLAWIFHRLTGLALVLFLFVHLWALGAAIEGGVLFEAQMSVFESTFFLFLESLIVIFVAFHMFNGLRIIATEFLGLNRSQKQLFQIALTASAGVMVVSGWMFFDKVFG